MSQSYKVIYDHNGRQKHYVTKATCPEGAEERFRSSVYGSFPVIRVEVLPRRGVRA